MLLQQRLRGRAFHRDVQRSRGRGCSISTAERISPTTGYHVIRTSSIQRSSGCSSSTAIGRSCECCANAGPVGTVQQFFFDRAHFCETFSTCFHPNTGSHLLSCLQWFFLIHWENKGRTSEQTLFELWTTTLDKKSMYILYSFRNY